mmetsp:Transcript_24892/g.48723  ORF Transcript_24892/g.48723 Transcript_24892/m.48723 type:complete len:84 (+) Transcript_24892:2-253(+)
MHTTRDEFRGQLGEHEWVRPGGEKCYCWTGALRHHCLSIDVEMKRSLSSDMKRNPSDPSESRISSGGSSKVQRRDVWGADCHS